MNNSLDQQILGYRICQQINGKNENKNNNPIQLRIIIQNQLNFRIKTKIICNGVQYSNIPLPLSILSNVNIIEQIETIILKAKNQILCKIISGQKNTLLLNQFVSIKNQMNKVFGLNLKLDSQQLCMIILSDQVIDDNQFIKLLDLTAQIQFVNLLKTLFQIGPTKVLPKIYRKLNKYFSLSKRQLNSIQRLKNVLKITKFSIQNLQNQVQIEKPYQIKQLQKKQYKKQVLAFQSKEKVQNIKQKKTQFQNTKQTIKVKKTEQKKQKDSQNKKIIDQIEKVYQIKSEKKQFKQKKQTNKQENHIGRRKDFDKYKKNKKYENNQNLQKEQTKQKKQNKKVDPRIIFGINGATDSVWRQRIRVPKYPNQYLSSQISNINQKQQKTQKQISLKQSNNQNTDSNLKTKSKTSQKNKILQKIFDLPNLDKIATKKFKFEKRDYNIYVNKLFWINISSGSITIQKQGKGFIRKCQIQIIDEGKGIMAEGFTLNLDGLSNLEDGGIPFNNPVFEQFTPNGQWFHITNLEVFTYI